MPASDPLHIDLSDDERTVLANGINEWGGPARCTEEFAVAMGFAGVSHLLEQTPRLHKAMREKLPLPQADWVRVLLLTEVVFASDVIGSGLDWESTTGLSDVTTLRTLREIQNKIPRAGVVGATFGTVPDGPFP